MSSENNTKITIAIIGLIGILGTAFIANWDKVFSPQPPPDKPMPYNNGINHEPPHEPPPNNEQAEISQRLEDLQRELENIERDQIKAHENIERLRPMLETDSDLQPVIEKEERWLENLEIDRNHVQREINHLRERM